MLATRLLQPQGAGGGQCAAAAVPRTRSREGGERRAVGLTSVPGPHREGTTPTSAHLRAALPTSVSRPSPCGTLVPRQRPRGPPCGGRPRGPAECAHSKPRQPGPPTPASRGPPTPASPDPRQPGPCNPVRERLYSRCFMASPWGRLRFRVYSRCFMASPWGRPRFRVYSRCFMASPLGRPTMLIDAEQKT
jgi:hypothetical protein